MELQIAIKDFCPCLCFGDYFFSASGNDGFLLKKNLLIENDEDFFIVQLIVVPLIGVLRVSFVLRRSTTLPFSIISTFVLPPCFAFILGILAVSFINESFLLAAGVKCSLFVIFKVFNFGRVNLGHDTLGHWELRPLGTSATGNFGHRELGPPGT